jgi:hypothetical protein
VTPATPSAQLEFFWYSPCQWIEVAVAIVVSSSSFQTRTLNCESGPVCKTAHKKFVNARRPTTHAAYRCARDQCAGEGTTCRDGTPRRAVWSELLVCDGEIRDRAEHLESKTAAQDGEHEHDRSAEHGETKHGLPGVGWPCEGRQVQRSPEDET